MIRVNLWIQTSPPAAGSKPSLGVVMVFFNLPNQIRVNDFTVTEMPFVLFGYYYHFYQLLINCRFASAHTHIISSENEFGFFLFFFYLNKVKP